MTLIVLGMNFVLSAVLVLHLCAPRPTVTGSSLPCANAARGPLRSPAAQSAHIPGMQMEFLIAAAAPLRSRHRRYYDGTRTITALITNSLLVGLHIKARHIPPSPPHQHTPLPRRQWHALTWCLPRDLMHRRRTRSASTAGRRASRSARRAASPSATTSWTRNSRTRPRRSLECPRTGGVCDPRLAAGRTACARAGFPRVRISFGAWLGIFCFVKLGLDSKQTQGSFLLWFSFRLIYVFLWMPQRRMRRGQRAFAARLLAHWM